MSRFGRLITVVAIGLVAVVGVTGALASHGGVLNDSGPGILGPSQVDDVGGVDEGDVDDVDEGDVDEGDVDDVDDEACDADEVAVQEIEDDGEVETECEDVDEPCE